jgi:hypothetical protein
MNFFKKKEPQVLHSAHLVLGKNHVPLKEPTLMKDASQEEKYSLRAELICV